MNPAPSKQMMSSPSGQNAPSVMLPARFIIAALTSLVLGVGLIIYRPEILSTYHYNQQVIAVTHLFTLGWILTVVMGATYQLVPVALETRLYSERLAKIQFVAHVVGFAGMVWMFWRWNLKGVGHFGSLLGIGVLLFVWNIGRTLWRSPRRSVVGLSVACMLGWLVLTVSVGLCIAAAKSSYSEDGVSATFAARAVQAVGSLVTRFDPIATMHAHAHAGVMGVFLVLIAGVSFRLVPMFTLSELKNERRATTSILMLNAGLGLMFVTILVKSAFKPVAAAMICAALVLYAIELRAILKARVRRKLDWGVRQFLTGLWFLAPLCLMGVYLGLPNLAATPLNGQLENAYGYTALLGLVSMAIIGMLYKIVPFIVWFSKYSKLIGLVKVPALADLYSARVQIAAYGVYLLGFFVTIAGVLTSHAGIVRSGCTLLLIAVSLVLWNIGRMFAHLWARDTRRNTPAVSEAANAAPPTGILGRSSAHL